MVSMKLKICCRISPEVRSETTSIGIKWSSESLELRTDTEILLDSFCSNCLKASKASLASSVSLYIDGLRERVLLISKVKEDMHLLIDFPYLLCIL